MRQIMNILESIQKILDFGIDLGECTDQECEEFIANLSWFINSKTSSQSNCEENKIVIENFSGEPVLALQIVKSRTLQFMPLSEDDFFESFMSVLEFISTDPSVPPYKQPASDSTRMKLKSNKPIPEIEEKEKKPEVSIDDFEWI